MNLISVEPLGDGWTVRLDEFGNDMVFRRGSDAEDAAKRLGKRIAEAGHPAEIRVFVRGGVLAGRFICEPRPLAGEPLYSGRDRDPRWITR